jgi:hypothetical protein
MVAIGWELQETFDQIENLLGAGSNGVAPATTTALRAKSPPPELAAPLQDTRPS